MKLPERNKMMCILFFMVCSVAANAQTTIKGIITNNNKDPQHCAPYMLRKQTRGFMLIRLDGSNLHFPEKENENWKYHQSVIQPGKWKLY